MFLYTCKDTVAPCVIKQLYFMYALLISVPIINCVNYQSSESGYFRAQAEKSAHDTEKCWTWIYQPSSKWNGLVNPVPSFIKCVFCPHSPQLTWADTGVPSPCGSLFWPRMQQWERKNWGWPNGRAVAPTCRMLTLPQMTAFWLILTTPQSSVNILILISNASLACFFS